MLSLKNINKKYKTENYTQEALKNISIDFRKNEFVCILGPSGSGKTTLLNIIGGLDRYTSGDLIINKKSTKDFKDTEWDAYRNNCVGFIFQNYNLINHINVLDNVKIGLTLSGKSNKKAKKEALEVLKKVNLQKHAYKKPNQLSGGQMQRVAIARALLNNPDIIMADEPTGALDSKTSIEVMNLITEIANNKLVIMVTHNESIAKKYATRIIELKDGLIINDTNPIKKDEIDEYKYTLKKTSMKYKTALALSFNNIVTKKGRTILTSFAASIGIIGIALILSLSNGFQIQIDKFEKDTLSTFPIIVTETAMNLDDNTIKSIEESNKNSEEYISDNKIIPLKNISNTMIHTNNITSQYVDYVENIDDSYVDIIAYGRITNIILLNNNGGLVSQIDSSIFTLPALPSIKNNNYLKKNFDILKGDYPKNNNDIVILLDSKNRLDETLLYKLGIPSNKDLKFEEIINKEYKLIFNDDYYLENNGYYKYNTNLKSLYESKNAKTIKIVGIIRSKKDNKLYENNNGLIFTEDLFNLIVDNNKNSKIVKDQIKKSYNILTGEYFENEEAKESVLTYLGENKNPNMINIFPKDFKTKNLIVTELDKYNNSLNEKDKIIYTDLASSISSLSSKIMDAITIVLIAFSSISLVVSCIMIGIITYISVLERTKEIGILRSLGARKKDITRVFNAETFIIGIFSGLIGIIIAYLLTIPINILIERLTDLPNVAKMNFIHMIVLLFINISLTIISGYLPAKIASKKDPVEALRTE